MNKKLQGDLMLLLTAIIWGSSFVAQRAGMELIGPFTFNGIRSYIGFLVLIPVILILDKNKKSKSVKPEGKPKDLLLGGLCCGIALFVAGSLQQIGIVYTTAGKAGFITALYVVLVPILGIFIGKKIRPLIWLCVAMSAFGLYLLCIKVGFSPGKGDMLVLLCALGFAIHILIIDYFSKKADGVKLSALQFLITGILSTPIMFILENPDLGNILDCWIPIGYAGVLSCGVAYTLQIVAQRYTDPTVASLLLCLESVFAVIAGILILHEAITPRELIGCIIMFAAIVLAQLPEKKNALGRREGN